jgi:hypothetical protein
MSGDKTFFENNPPKHLDERIMKAAGVALNENRRAHFRRKVLTWFTLPAVSLAGLALFFKIQDEEPKDSVAVAEFLDFHELNEDEQDMMNDLDVFEDLEILEKWEES